MTTDFTPHFRNGNVGGNRTGGLPGSRFANLVKSLLHNMGVVAVGFGVACLGAALDSLGGFIVFKSRLATTAAWLLLAGGFLLRVWATVLFYEQRMKVISLVPQ